MSYIRYFMPMISEAKGYGYKDRQPVGRSIVEGRSGSYKLTIWAQDLKPETLYNVYLLFPNQNNFAGIALGNLPVCKRGKAEIRREFDPGTLCDFPLEDIIAVAVTVKDAISVTTPLCGYKDAPVAWRHGFYVHKVKEVTVNNETQGQTKPGKAEDHKKSNESTSEPITHKPTQPAQVTEALDVQPIKVDESPAIRPNVATMPMPDTRSLDSQPVPVTAPIPSHENQDAHTTPTTPITSREPEPLQTLGSITLPPTEQPQTVDSDNVVSPTDSPAPSADTPPPLDTSPGPANAPSPAPQPAPITIDWAQSLPTGEMANAFRGALDKLHAETMKSSAKCPPNPSILELFDANEAITPFQRQTRKAKWIRVTQEDSVPPPANKPKLFEDPFVKSAAALHGHLILGLTTDQGPRRYIIGVPGTYNQASNQKAKRLGFTQFKPTRDTKPHRGESGYWLMFVTMC